MTNYDTIYLYKIGEKKMGTKFKDEKGFTLIELLAVIVILGVLMMVAIPMMSKYIDNARRDAFADTAKTYIQSARYMMLNDSFLCDGVASSGLNQGKYYIDVKDIDLDKGGTSPWGSRELKGYVQIDVTDSIDADGKGDYKYEYLISLVDGTHGIPTFTKESSVTRGSVKSSGATAAAAVTSMTKCDAQ